MQVEISSWPAAFLWLSLFSSSSIPFAITSIVGMPRCGFVPMLDMLLMLSLVHTYFYCLLRVLALPEGVVSESPLSFARGGTPTRSLWLTLMNLQIILFQQVSSWSYFVGLCSVPSLGVFVLLAFLCCLCFLVMASSTFNIFCGTCFFIIFKYGSWTSISCLLLLFHGKLPWIPHWNFDLFLCVFCVHLVI